MKRFAIGAEVRRVFYIEADSEEEAQRIAVQRFNNTSASRVDTWVISADPFRGIDD